MSSSTWLSPGPVKTLDEVLDSIPLGRYHYQAVGLFFLSYLMDGSMAQMANILAQCTGDGLALNNKLIGVVGSALFVGEIFGSMVIFQYADIAGRRPAILLALGIISSFLFILAICETFPAIVFGLFGIGIGVGATGLNFTAVTEIAKTDDRSTYNTIVQSGWGMGSVVCIGFASLIIGGGDNWRYLVIALGCVAVMLLGLLYIYLPETIRWLYNSGNLVAAKTAVHEAAAMSGGSVESFSFSKKNKIIKNKETGSEILSEVESEGDNIDEGETCMDVSNTALLKISTKVKEVFSSDEGMLKDVLLSIGQLTSSLFVYFGICFLQAKYLQVSTGDDAVCAFSYYPMALGGLLEIASTFLIYFCDTHLQYGRRDNMMLTSSLTLLSLLVVITTGNDTIKAVLLSLARGFSFAYNVPAWTNATELFRTEYRATAFSLSYISSRIGIVLSSLLVNSIIPENALVAIYSICSAMSFVISYSLRETKGLDIA